MAVSIMASYDQVGRKEDISDVITTITPTKTPFQAIIGSENIHNIVKQWQEDSLNAVAANAQVEGANAISAVQNATVMRSNTTQIFMKTASVTGTADTVETYGRDRELAYQLSLRSAEIKRDLENAYVGVNQAAVTGSDGVARSMASALNMIATANNYFMGAGTPLGGNSGTPAALSETAVLAVSQQLYAQGADPDTILVKPGDSLTVANFQTNSRTRFVENGTKDVVNVVNFYESPFGRLKVVMDRFILPTSALVFEASMWKKLVLRNWFRETLAKVGDSTQVMIVGEMSLRHKNFQASGAITNLV
jgi:uncharacterized protein YbjQ (UPF0145 family)